MDYYDIFPARRKRLPDDHPADGVLLFPDGSPLALVEVKSRHDFTVDEFFGRYGTWLVTNAKIKKNEQIALRRSIPFLGALHIVQSKIVLVKTIFDGVEAPGIEVRRTRTQATINGGSAIRDNAYIPMHDAIRVRY